MLCVDESDKLFEVVFVDFGSHDSVSAALGGVAISKLRTKCSISRSKPHHGGLQLVNPLRSAKNAQTDELYLP
jgi:hypothetical protein